ncbi:succinate dehydrogenase cytochrome b560 subunit, mitochondrial-like isoform X2 [Lycorma delicatula]|uniref:succinate dehydrogenase cytochrome b560 subunit, mitochondrial-like isoform X2 n=1 Tax=Lycorma delicatula TaxID=130591 RepID=UPI003F512629
MMVSLSSLSKLTRPSFCGISGLQQSRCVVLRPIKSQNELHESYENKNERLGRPMSPHVTIYKMQFQSYLSIFHRMTGLVTYGYFYFLAAGTFFCPFTYPEAITMIQDAHLNPVLIYGAKFVLAFPFAYHFSNGLRHLIWDATAKFLTIPGVFSSGYAVLGLATLFTLYLLSL